jgi:hypothetical protein
LVGLGLSCSSPSRCTTHGSNPPPPPALNPCAVTPPLKSTGHRRPWVFPMCPVRHNTHHTSPLLAAMAYCPTSATGGMPPCRSHARSATTAASTVSAPSKLPPTTGPCTSPPPPPLLAIRPPRRLHRPPELAITIKHHRHCRLRPLVVGNAPR